MGMNPSRYKDIVTARAIEQQYVERMTRGIPLTLSDTQIQIDRSLVIKPPRPLRVEAWVLYQLDGLALQTRVEAVCDLWTLNAARLYWKAPSGDMHRAWVWRGAIITDRGAAGERQADYGPAL